MADPSPGMVLVSPDGVRHRFDAGALCLELLLTGGPGELAIFETLHEPADLADWAARSRLRPSPEVAVTAAELATGRHLRNTLLRIARDQAQDRPLAPEDVEVLNTAASAPPLSPVLREGGVGWAGAASGTQLLSTVARDAIELFGGPYADRVRECEAGDCRLLFVDTSRPGKRRWCSMGRCGNRHKVRASRARANSTT